MNLLDHLFIKEAIENGQTEDGLDKAREALNKVYNRTGTTLKELYHGGSNDEAGEDGVELPPYQSSRAPRPMLSRTMQDETGFQGLEAPLG